MNFHNDFDANVTTFYKILRDTAGYHTMVTGRDDLDKSSGGPGIDGMKHTDELGFSDSVRCDGSTDVTSGGVPHEPYGKWLKSQRIVDPAVASQYNCTDLFQLKLKRFQEIGRVSMKGNSYAIDHPQPLNGTLYQDNWIGAQALALLRRRPMGKSFFIEVSHQAPHPPMDVTANMVAHHDLRSRQMPPPAECEASGHCYTPASIQVGRQNYAAKIERLDYWLGEYLSLLEVQQVASETITCIASDHGEMLFDRGVTAKSRPWSSASSVPLICAGPGIVADRVVSSAVSTVDLGPTFLDFAGVLDAAPPGMSTVSMKALMQAPSLQQPTQPPRKTVHFGLNNFRGVIQTLNATHILKFFCCSARDHGPATGGQPVESGCPGSTPRDQAGFNLSATDEFHLFNVVRDRFETPESDLRHAFPDLVRQMAALLPPPHQTPPASGSKIERQGYGYRWPGCVLQS
jgi:hypothetical protein